MADWNELASQIAVINRWLRPLQKLAEIPEAVQAAQNRVKTLEAETLDKEKTILELDEIIKARKKDAGMIDAKFAAAWSKKEVELQVAANKIAALHEADLVEVKQSIAKESKYLMNLKEQNDQELSKFKDEKAQIEAEIEAKRKELEEMSSILAKFSKK